MLWVKKNKIFEGTGPKLAVKNDLIRFNHMQFHQIKEIFLSLLWPVKPLVKRPGGLTHLRPMGTELLVE
jgi:hypothetical protein